eukprot:8194058-Pyramimonas_sp.AAC.1
MESFFVEIYKEAWNEDNVDDYVHFAEDSAENFGEKLLGIKARVDLEGRAGGSDTGEEEFDPRDVLSKSEKATTEKHSKPAGKRPAAKETAPRSSSSAAGGPDVEKELDAALAPEAAPGSKRGRP